MLLKKVVFLIPVYGYTEYVFLRLGVGDDNALRADIKVHPLQLFVGGCKYNKHILYEYIRTKFKHFIDSI